MNEELEKMNAVMAKTVKAWASTWQPSPQDLQNLKVRETGSGNIQTLKLPIFKPIMPIKLVVKQADREVLVKFSDNTYRVAKCDERDTFDIEVGVMIAILKRYGGTYKTIKPFLEQVASEKKKMSRPKQAVGENAPSKVKSGEIKLNNLVSHSECKMTDTKINFTKGVTSLGNITPTSETPNDKIEVGDTVKVYDGIFGVVTYTYETRPECDVLVNGENCILPIDVLILINKKGGK